MIGENEFDRLLTSWLETDGPQDVPVRLVDDALASARRQGQLGGWLDGLLGRRWQIDPTGIWSPGGRRLVTIALVAMLTVALVGVGVLAGAAILDHMRAVPAPTALPVPSALPASTALPGPTQAALRSGPLRFSPTGSMSVARSGHTATLLDDGRVLITGGRDGHARSQQATVGSAEIYDPSTQTFSRTGSMSAHRTNHAAVRLADGRVLVTGGEDDDLGVVLDTAEVYDASTSTFENAGSMLSPRAGHTAVLLADGRVAIIGGAIIGSYSEVWPTAPMAAPGIEIFDPSDGSFKPALAGPEVQRTMLDAFALPDGRVLVVGGQVGHRSMDAIDLVAGTVSPVTPIDGPPQGGPVPSRSWRATRLPDGTVVANVDDQLHRGWGLATIDPATNTYMWRVGYPYGSEEAPLVGPTSLDDGTIVMLFGRPTDCTTVDVVAVEPGTWRIETVASITSDTCAGYAWPPRLTSLLDGGALLSGSYQSDGGTVVDAAIIGRVMSDPNPSRRSGDEPSATPNRSPTLTPRSSEP